ncbi:putative endopeptidase p60 [bioreactor metagenome]|uniref:Putative endopeptidase p60 n=1 Tax=bioreactor metagenome TaxID=1076179 RepID=A0A645GL39_9ZZZZ
MLNHSGAASVGRTNARRLYKKSTVVSRENARPGDLIFFTGARAAEIGHPVTHVGIYVGNGMMLHCAGNGVEYKSISTKYYKSHFYAFGRLG